jgi:hypothetical protein
MSRAIFQWRCGSPPNYSYIWAFEAPEVGATIVDHIDEGETVVKQERRTFGHYRVVPCVYEVPPPGEGESGVRYHDCTVPNYTNGWDFMRAVCPTGDMDSGDEIVTAKLLGGQIGSLSAGAASGATTVTVVAPKGALAASELGGFGSEGFFLSFGNDTATAASINAGPPSKDSSGTWTNPDQELREYEIKRISAETDIGGGYATVTVELFSALGQDLPAGTPVNLVVKFLLDPWPIVKGDLVDIGGDHLSSGPLPANKVLRYGFRNTGSSAKTVRGYMKVLYG